MTRRLFWQKTGADFAPQAADPAQRLEGCYRLARALTPGALCVARQVAVAVDRMRPSAISARTLGSSLVATGYCPVLKPGKVLKPKNRQRQNTDCTQGRPREWDGATRPPVTSGQRTALFPKHKEHEHIMDFMDRGRI